MVDSLPELEAIATFNDLRKSLLVGTVKGKESRKHTLFILIKWFKLSHVVMRF